jgi:outer membrane protein assembly factor BamB
MNKVDAGRPNFGFRNAMSGAVADGRLVLLTSINGWPQPQVPPQQIYQQFPVAVCVNAADGKEVWKRPLEQGVQKHGPVGPPAFTPTQAIIAVRDSQNMSTRLNVLERETGNPLINNKALTGPFTNGDERWQRAWQSGFPQVVGSYLLVETPDGVMVWSGR